MRARHDPDALTRLSSAPGGNATGVGSIESYQLESHTHGVSDPGHGHTEPYGNFLTHGSGSGSCGPGYAPGGNFIPSICESPSTNASTTGVSIAAAGGNEDRPTNLAVNYIIKL